MLCTTFKRFGMIAAAMLLPAIPEICKASIPLHGFRADMTTSDDKFVPLDINGDGKTDFLWYRPGAGYAGVYISQGNGDLRFIEYCRAGASYNGFVGDLSDSNDTLMPLDINGDGKVDFLYYRPGKGWAGVYISNGDGSLRYVEYSTPDHRSNGFTGDVSDTRDRAAVLDINGDGKMDFLWYRPGAGWAGVYISKGDGTLTYLGYSTPDGQSNGFTGDVSNNRDRALPLDVNGDGRTDFLWYRPGAGWAGVYLSNGDGTLRYVAYSTPDGQSNGFISDAKDERDVAVALDINGDRRMDFLWYRPGGGYATMYISKGDGTLQSLEYCTAGKSSNGFSGDVSDPADRAVALDINGDGKSDFLWYRPGKGYAGVHIAASDGSGHVTYTGYSSPSGQTNGFAGDVSSDQDMAIALNLTGNKASDFLWFRRGKGYAAAVLSRGGSVDWRSYEGATATWMNDLSDQIATVPMKGIAMPGTHDSAMYGSGLPDADLAKNQEDDFTGQLNAGARYFDMRLGYVNTVGPANQIVPVLADGTHLTCDYWNMPTVSGYYMWGHSNICTNIKVSDAFDQFKTFLDSHPKEIVFLEMYTLVGGSSRSAEFLQLLRDHLGKYIYLNNCSGGTCSKQPQEVTPQELWNSNQRIILLNKGDGISAPELWDVNAARTAIGYKDPGIVGDPDAELAIGESGLNTTRPAWTTYTSSPTMTQLQVQLTPFGALGGAGCAVHCLDGPIGLAQWINPALVTKLQGDWRSRELNAVTVDYVSCCGVADAIINNNSQRWQYVPGLARDFGTGADGSVWKVDDTLPSKGVVRLWTSSGWSAQLNKQASKIAVEPNGVPWIIDPSGSIWRLRQSTLASVHNGNGGDAWDLMLGAASDIGIGGDGSIWVIGGGSILYKFNGTSWDQLSTGGGVRIGVDNSGHPWVIATDNKSVWRYDGSNWVRLPGADFASLTDIAVGPENSVWITGADYQGVPGLWRWDTLAWNRYRGDASAIAVDSNGAPWAVANGGSFVGSFR